MKTCTKCKQTKPLEEFNKQQWADGRRPECAECRRRYSRERQKRLGSTELTSRKYGINAGLYTDILGIQNGGCAICGSKPSGRALAIDHDHATGKLRGILCANCNGGLGMFRDDANLLERAIGYLNFWKVGWEMFDAIAYQETRGQVPPPEHCKD